MIRPGEGGILSPISSLEMAHEPVRSEMISQRLRLTQRAMYMVFGSGATVGPLARSRKFLQGQSLNSNHRVLVSLASLYYFQYLGQYDEDFLLSLALYILTFRRFCCVEPLANTTAAIKPIPSQTPQSSPSQHHFTL
jgi:hypothetical protein